MSTQAQPVRIFIAYSTHDLAFKEEIRKRLKPLLRAGKVTVWDNWDIEAGANWDNVIQENLHQADLILLLLSPDALDSDYFYEVEAPIALRRHKAGEAITVGVLLRPCALKHTPFEFEQYELLPKKGYPITDPRWPNADEAYLTVVEEVDVLVERIKVARNPKVEKVAKEGQVVNPEPFIKMAWALLEAATPKTTKKLQKESDPFYKLMVSIKGGSFDMGNAASNGYDDEKPFHRVTVPDFLLCKYPVTQGQWKQIMGATNSHFQGNDNLPVEGVNWEDTQAFIKLLNMVRNREYRLPTEAEWEFAAKGGAFSKGFRFAGSNELGEVAWYSENSDSQTHPVGEKKANELGLYDMSGNVWEWVQDDWHSDYVGAPADGSAWVDRPNRSEGRILRGGSWFNGTVECFTTTRHSGSLIARGTHVGFRLAHSLPYK